MAPKIPDKCLVVEQAVNQTSSFSMSLLITESSLIGSWMATGYRLDCMHSFFFFFFFWRGLACCMHSCRRINLSKTRKKKKRPCRYGCQESEQSQSQSQSEIQIGLHSGLNRKQVGVTILDDRLHKQQKGRSRDTHEWMLRYSTGT